MYGSGPEKVAESAGISLEEAKDAIKEYFNRFPQLKAWLDSQKEAIQSNGCAYSIFGRKRRLNDVFSSVQTISGHEVRSGINFLIQSVASDINLYAAIDMARFLIGKESKLLALVHDSIMIEVKEEELDEVIAHMAKVTQQDRGCSIPGFPIGIDVEIGDDYSFGGYDKWVEELANETT